MTDLFYWTGVAMWGTFIGGAAIILFALVATAISNGLKKQVRK